MAAGVGLLRQAEPAVLARDLDAERPDRAQAVDDVFGDLALAVDRVRVHLLAQERLELCEERRRLARRCRSGAPG